MAETIVSPGVIAIENDQSFITQQPIQAGAAIIGPTVKGPVGIPTICTTYTDYKNKFGSEFLSGSQSFTYFTSISAYQYFTNGGNSLLVTRVISGSTTDWTPATSSFISSSAHSAGSPYNQSPFDLATISEGEIMNSAGPNGTNGSLLSGSETNFRWEIFSSNISSGTFSLRIRKGNDTSTSVSTVEEFLNLSLDPLASNYIERQIGNQFETILSDNGEYYVQKIGDYPNRSAHVRVKSVNQPTPGYFNNSGTPLDIFTGSIPLPSQNGVFGDGKGKNIPTGVAGAYYENITNANIQGLSAASYVESISLLSNKSAYKYNFITAPGLIGDAINYDLHYPVVQQLNTMVRERGDTMAIIDISSYSFSSSILSVIDNSLSFDTSYSATYWPWLKSININTGANVWSPPSTLIPAVYAKNDSIIGSYPWFAPAGMARGAMPYVIQTERILTLGNKDSLYESNINPIINFPGQAGAVVFGQKTLQRKKSALDRVNVRRLLIELKNFISQLADSFVFEQNNETTRDELLSLINSYLFNVQQKQGLTSFQVIIDDSNNTPETIDQNQLIGQIYIQPTRTAEFIILDFNILPTGTNI